MRSFGVKNVDFGGISRPSRAVRSISATLTGRISTAAVIDASEPSRSSTSCTPCWYVTLADVSASACSSHAPSRLRTSSNAPLARHQPLAASVGVDEAQVAALVHLGERLGADVRGLPQLEVPRERPDQVDPADVAVHAVDRGDAQLLGHELAHERERQLRRRLGAVGVLAHLVAVRACDRVAMVPIGDQHVVGPHHRADRLDAHLVRDPLHRVAHAVDDHRSDRFARLGQQRREALANDRPHTGDRLAFGRPCQIETVGLRLRCGALVGEHASGSLVDDFEPTEHTHDLALAPGLVGERHPVQGERRLRIAHQHPVGHPLPQPVGGRLVPAVAVALTRHVDVDDVVLAPRLERVDVGLGQHVVRRCDQVVDV